MGYWGPGVDVRLDFDPREIGVVLHCEVENVPYGATCNRRVVLCRPENFLDSKNVVHCWSAWLRHHVYLVKTRSLAPRCAGGEVYVAAALLRDDFREIVGISG